VILGMKRIDGDRAAHQRSDQGSYQPLLDCISLLRHILLSLCFDLVCTAK
jgi:hypothetical protein